MPATDWIKMRSDLYRDPKVCVMADALLAPTGALARHVARYAERDMSVTRNVTRNAVVGALVSVWGVMRHRGKRRGDDLVVRGVPLSVLDDVADLPGFGLAMEAVGWARVSDSDLVFPRFFEEFNVEPGTDKASQNAERQRRHREKLKADSNALRNVTDPSQSNAREEREKRREEKEMLPSEACPEPPKTADAGPAVLTAPTTGSGAKEWHLTAAKLAEYEAAFPALDVLAALRAAVQWCRDNPAKRKTAKGMPAFCSNWLTRSQNGGQFRRGEPAPAEIRNAGSAKPVTPVDRDARIAALAARAGVRITQETPPCPTPPNAPAGTSDGLPTTPVLSEPAPS